MEENLDYSWVPGWIESHTKFCRGCTFRSFPISPISPIRRYSGNSSWVGIRKMMCGPFYNPCSKICILKICNWLSVQNAAKNKTNTEWPIHMYTFVITWNIPPRIYNEWTWTFPVQARLCWYLHQVINIVGPTEAQKGKMKDQLIKDKELWWHISPELANSKHWSFDILFGDAPV